MDEQFEIELIQILEELSRYLDKIIDLSSFLESIVYKLNSLTPHKPIGLLVEGKKRHPILDIIFHDVSKKPGVGELHVTPGWQHY